MSLPVLPVSKTRGSPWSRTKPLQREPNWHMTGILHGNLRFLSLTFSVVFSAYKRTYLDPSYIRCRRLPIYQTERLVSATQPEGTKCSFQLTRTLNINLPLTNQTCRRLHIRLQYGFFTISSGPIGDFDIFHPHDFTYFWHFIIPCSNICPNKVQDAL